MRNTLYDSVINKTNKVGYDKFNSIFFLRSYIIEGIGMLSSSNSNSSFNFSSVSNGFYLFRSDIDVTSSSYGSMNTLDFYIGKSLYSKCMFTKSKYNLDLYDAV